MIWNLKTLIKHCNENSAEINGKWVPARPLNFQYRTFLEKVKDSWAVYKGKAEAFKWPEEQ